MSSAERLSYQEMAERIIKGNRRVPVTIIPSHEAIRALVREEMQAIQKAQEEQQLDSLLEAVQGEPDPEDEIVAILAEYTEDEFDRLVQRVKETKK